MPDIKLKVIDLSKWNGAVDFAKVKASGIDGVIIRTGFGVKSPNQVDRCFEEHRMLSRAVCTKMVKAFCDRLEIGGAWAGIFSYDTFFRDKLSADIPKCVPEGNIDIWQYSWKTRSEVFRAMWT